MIPYELVEFTPAMHDFLVEHGFVQGGGGLSSYAVSMGPKLKQRAAFIFQRSQHEAGRQLRLTVIDWCGQGLLDLWAVERPETPFVTFDAVEVLGSFLEFNGYGRVFSARVLYYYIYLMASEVLAGPRVDVAKVFLRAASFATAHFSDARQLELVKRNVDLVEFKAVLATGVPYALAIEAYPVVLTEG